MPSSTALLRVLGALLLTGALSGGLFLASRAEEPKLAAAPQAPAPTESPAATLEAGMVAPDFSLQDQDGKTHRLSDLRGKTVILAFYPKDDTPGWTAQMCALRDTLPRLKNKKTLLFGISVQDTASHRAFADKHRLTFPLLADVEKKTSRAYGVLGQNGFAERVTFIIGPNGRIKNIDRASRFTRTPGGIASAHGDALAQALSDEWNVGVGLPVPSFALKNYDGKTILSTDAKTPLTVLLFVSTSCPVSNAYNARMEQLAQKFGEKARFLAINSNRGETVERIADHARKNSLSFPVLKDEGGRIADRFRAQVTPEVWVIDARGFARYHGAIDDSQEESGIKSRYLEDGLTALLDGKEPPMTETKAFGCAIKRGGK